MYLKIKSLYLPYIRNISWNSLTWATKLSNGIILEVLLEVNTYPRLTVIIRRLGSTQQKYLRTGEIPPALVVFVAGGVSKRFLVLSFSLFLQ